MLDTRIAVLGCGTMGRAIVEGLLQAGFDPSQCVVTTRRAQNVAGLAEELGVEVTTDNAAAVGRADVVLACLKPDCTLGVVASVADALADKLLISIAAGVTLDKLESAAPKARVIRAMPNTPSLIGEGMTVLSSGASATEDDRARARAIFEAVGRVAELDHKHMNAVTALSGSGPAFVYVMLEAMADGGVMMGLPRDVSLTIAAQVFAGSARMVLEGHDHPAALKDQVTTPAGCTIAGLLTLEDGRIRSVLARAIQEASKVAGGLG